LEFAVNSVSFGGKTYPLDATIASAAHSITARAVASVRRPIVPACPSVTSTSCHVTAGEYSHIAAR
jgi:hypothetical protein